jgi:hypothetical protein
MGIVARYLIKKIAKIDKNMSTINETDISSFAASIE